MEAFTFVFVLLPFLVLAEDAADARDKMEDCLDNNLLSTCQDPTSLKSISTVQDENDHGKYYYNLEKECINFGGNGNTGSVITPCTASTAQECADQCSASGKCSGFKVFKDGQNGQLVDKRDYWAACGDLDLFRSKWMWAVNGTFWIREQRSPEEFNQLLNGGTESTDSHQDSHQEEVAEITTKTESTDSHQDSHQEEVDEINAKVPVRANVVNNIVSTKSNQSLQLKCITTEQNVDEHGNKYCDIERSCINYKANNGGYGSVRVDCSGPTAQECADDCSSRGSCSGFLVYANGEDVGQLINAQDAWAPCLPLDTFRSSDWVHAVEGTFYIRMGFTSEQFKSNLEEAGSEKELELLKKLEASE